MPSYQYRKSHCGDKTVVRSSYLHNGISYTGKTASLYWISPLAISMAGVRRRLLYRCYCDSYMHLRSVCLLCAYLHSAVECSIIEILRIQTYQNTFKLWLLGSARIDLFFQWCPPCCITWIDIDKYKLFKMNPVTSHSNNCWYCSLFFVSLRFVADQFTRIPQSLTVLALRKLYIIRLHLFLVNTWVCTVKNKNKWIP